jgi:hypothetical protein
MAGGFTRKRLTAKEVKEKGFLNAEAQREAGVFRYGIR